MASEKRITCPVWLNVRVMSGQIGCDVRSDEPSLWVNASSTQYQ